jgi:hypothetical protein
LGCVAWGAWRIDAGQRRSAERFGLFLTCFICDAIRLGRMSISRLSTGFPTDIAGDALAHDLSEHPDHVLIVVEDFVVVAAGTEDGRSRPARRAGAWRDSAPIGGVERNGGRRPGRRGSSAQRGRRPLLEP